MAECDIIHKGGRVWLQSPTAAHLPCDLLVRCASSQALTDISLSFNCPGKVVVPILQVKQLRLLGSERCDIFSKVKEVAEPGLDPS